MSTPLAAALAGAVLLTPLGPAAGRPALAAVQPEAGQPAKSAAELVGALPEGANAIGVLHVQKLLKSPRGAAAGWGDKVRSAYIAGATVVPKWAETVVVGAPVHPGEHGTPWIATVISGPTTLGVAQLAPGGREELADLGGKPSFVSRGGAYVAELGPGWIGSYSPAQRQAASRWVQSVGAADGDANADGPTPFLAAAAATDADVILALDLAEMFDPEAVTRFVGEVPDVPSENVAAIADLLTGARGIWVTVDVTNEIAATLQVRFGRPIDVPAETLGEVLEAALAASGLLLPEFSDATFQAEGETLTTTFPLSGESFSLLVSLLSGVHSSDAEHSPADVAEAAPASRDGRTGATYDAAATRRYGKAVQDAVARMERLNSRGTSFQNGLRFLNSTSHRLHELPTRGVAPALVERGDAIAKGMAALSASFQGAAVEVDAAQRALVWNVNYDPGAVAVSWWGGVGYRPARTQVDSNLAAVRQQQAQAVAAGAPDRAQIWQMIEEDAEVVGDLLKQLDAPAGAR